MKNRRFVVQCILFLQILFAGCLFSLTGTFASQDTLEKIKTTGVLNWGFDAEGGAPYVFHDPKNPQKLIGFEVELVDAIARELGVKVHHFQNAWDSILLSLQRGDFDVALNGIEITPDREQAVLFTRPYYVYAEQIVVRASDNRINGLEDLRGKKVGTLYNTVAKRMLEEMGGVTISLYGQVESFKDLLLSRIDAIFLDLPIASYYAMPNPQLRLAGSPVGEGYYGAAVRKEDTALAGELNRIIEELLRSGELKKIYERWGLWNTAQERLFLHEGLLQKYSENPPSVSEKGSHVMVVAFLPTLLKGALVTIGISLLSMMLAVCLGLGLALMRLYGNKWLQKISTAYIEIYRGTPLLIQLYILYYGLPNVGITLSALAAAVLGLGMNYAAYEAEIYRAGIQAIPKGQTEAALSLGMSRRLALRRVILPQALRVALPSITNDFIALFKDSSLVSVIALVELTKSYSILAAASMNFFQLGIITALLYFGMSYPLSLYARRLEKRLARQ